MSATFARSPHGDPPDWPAPQAAWRWRYHDPDTGEWVSHSELLTTGQISAIDPHAQLIPGSRVLAAAPRRALPTTR